MATITGERNTLWIPAHCLRPAAQFRPLTSRAGFRNNAVEGNGALRTGAAMKVSRGVQTTVAILLVAAVIASRFFLPLEGYYQAYLHWVRGWGAWGAVCLALSYIPCCLLFLPSSLLTLGAGFSYGLVGGTLMSSLGLMLGSTAPFLVSRTVGRGWIERRIRRDPKLAAIDRMVGSQGFKIMLLIRLSPVFLFDLTSYALGLTEVRWGHYVLATWLGKLPESLLLVYIGAAAKNLAAGKVRVGAVEPILTALGLVAAIAAVIFVTHLARRALREATGEGPLSPERDAR
jgi:uncharacterized membrane protein YdjX (TVP38/TMEM64 family)